VLGDFVVDPPFELFMSDVGEGYIESPGEVLLVEVGDVVASLEVGAVVLLSAEFAAPDFDGLGMSLVLSGTGADDDEPPAETRTSAQLKNSSGVSPVFVHDNCEGLAPIDPPSPGHPAQAEGYL
jgi:hypothetical protein